MDIMTWACSLAMADPMRQEDPSTGNMSPFASQQAIRRTETARCVVCMSQGLT